MNQIYTDSQEIKRTRNNGPENPTGYTYSGSPLKNKDGMKLPLKHMSLNTMSTGKRPYNLRLPTIETANISSTPKQIDPLFELKSPTDTRNHDSTFRVRGNSVDDNFSDNNIN